MNNTSLCLMIIVKSFLDFNTFTALKWKKSQRFKVRYFLQPKGPKQPYRAACASGYTVFNFFMLCYGKPRKKSNVKHKVKVSPIYDPYARGCLLERTLVLGRQHCEVGWPVPFLAAFIPQYFHRVPICCWLDSERASNHWF